MRNRIIFMLIVVFIALPAISKDIDKAYFNKLKKEVNLQKDEQLVVIYQDIGSCVKCYLHPMQIVGNLKKKGKIKKFKLLALVKCDRDIELEIYKEQHKWKYYMYRDDGDAYKRLKAKKNTYVSVFNYSGKKLKDVK